ncbi:hypothetical protein MO973_19960 [Paenibacillus sp. TRM 82003]|nr:hypothetical protein [Paenibacillus sp. TRM 82003]
MNILRINLPPILDAPEGMKGWAKEQVQEALIGALEALRDVVVDLSYSIALVGGGVCILLWISGWRDGKRWSGILLMAHILISFLLGGL